MSDGPPIAAIDGLRAAIRLSPRAKSDRLVAIVVTVEARRVVKATAAAVPKGRRANAALLQLLARTWRLPRVDLPIATDATRRRKVARFAGDAHQLIGKVTPEIAGLPGW